MTNNTEKISNNEQLFDLVKNAAVDNRLSCGMAHKLVEETGFTLLEIGQACDELKIKIQNCQLGCF